MTFEEYMDFTNSLWVLVFLAEIDGYQNNSTVDAMTVVF